MTAMFTNETTGQVTSLSSLIGQSCCCMSASVRAIQNCMKLAKLLLLLLLLLSTIYYYYEN